MTVATAMRMLHVQHTFLYISLPSLHDCDVKMPNFTFYGGVGHGGGGGAGEQVMTNCSFSF